MDESQLLLDMTRFYREIEPNFVEGERVIATEDITDTVRKGRPGIITVEFVNEIHGIPVQAFWLGIHWGDQIMFGTNFWDKIAPIEVQPPGDYRSMTTGERVLVIDPHIYENYELVGDEQLVHF